MTPQMSAMIDGPVSDLQYLETLAEQSTACKRASRRYKTGWQLPSNLERASVARERKPVVAPPKQAPIAPAPLPPAAPCEIYSYDDLVLALRQRADELEISRATIDELAGVPDRYSNKVLSIKKVRRIGMETLAAFLGALSVKLVMVEDPIALARNRSRMVKRNKSQVRVHQHPAA